MTPRLMLAGTGSGCGKTSMTCAILGALKARGMCLASFKCGPDYIDPMFHTKILGIPSRNLDTFLCPEDTICYLLQKNAAQAELAIIEGVMGFYDGLSGTRTEASSWHLSQVTQTPVVLVVSCAGKSLSLAAQVQGYQRFLPNQIAGVLLNHASAHAYPMYKSIIEEHCGIPVLGYLPRMPQASLESRHLGLITAAEVHDIRQKMQLLAEQAAQSVDLDALLALAQVSPPLEASPPRLPGHVADVRIAVARDAAFCFYYEDNLDLLRSMGAQIAAFSPLHDTALPPEIDGVYIGGGYPELYAQALSQNTSMLQSVHDAVTNGLPAIAECGGFLYLCESMHVADDKQYRFTGVLPAQAHMGERLSRFGYAVMTANCDNLLCKAGESIPVHEFHYSDTNANGDGFHMQKPYRPGGWDCAHATQTLYAGYPHMHLWANPAFAERFIRACGAGKGKIR